MKTVMLYRGDSPHPAHQGFVEAIGADTFRIDQRVAGLPAGTIPAEILNGVRLNGYEVYIAEGTRSLYGALSNQLGSESILIYLAADLSISQLQNRNSAEQSMVNRLIGNYGMGVMKTVFSRNIDGVIAVSNLTAESVGTVVDAPVRIAHPYINPEMYERLGNFTPNIERKSAVTVGTYTWYKGQDILPDVWSQVREQHPEAELFLIGDGYPESLNENPGIIVCGFVEDLPSRLSESALYVHAARADAFPVSVLEALRLGLPSIVTATTGDRSVTRKLSEDFVVKRTVDALSTSINDYFSLSVKEKQNLSNEATKQGSKFDSRSRKEKFGAQFKSLIKQLEES